MQTLLSQGSTVCFVFSDESDFVPLNGQLCVVPGSTPAGVPVCCPITVLGDDVIENNEAFVVVVNPSDPGDVIVGSDTVAIVITDDNDCKNNSPSIS